MAESVIARWQPVLLTLNKRLECECGYLATIVSGKVSEEKYNVLEEADVWCQDCYFKAIEEQEEKA
jgi:hypothetical protein